MKLELNSVLTANTENMQFIKYENNEMYVNV